MAETNGHAPELTVTPEELDALLQGLFEPTTFEFAPGRFLEIRPLLLNQADRLYAGGLNGAELQRYLLARSVYVGGKPLGDDGAARLPVALANRLVPLVMDANGLDLTAGTPGEAPADPKP